KGRLAHRVIAQMGDEAVNEDDRPRLVRRACQLAAGWDRPDLLQAGIDLRRLGQQYGTKQREEQTHAHLSVKAVSVTVYTRAAPAEFQSGFVRARTPARREVVPCWRSGSDRAEDSAQSAPFLRHPCGVKIHIRTPSAPGRLVMSWKTKLLELCKKYGAAAKFAATTIMGAVLPGSPAVVSLVEQAFDSAEKKADNEWQIAVGRHIEATTADLDRLADMFDVLLGDMQHVTAQVARLQALPDVAGQIVETALVLDTRCQESARRLEALACRFERLEVQQQQLLSGQEEMLPLLRRTVGVCDYVQELRSSGLTPYALGGMLRSSQQALQMLAAGQLADAEKSLSGMSSERPQFATTTIALAAVQTVGRQFVQAEQSLGRARRLRPQDSELTELHSRVTAA